MSENLKRASEFKLRHISEIPCRWHCVNPQVQILNGCIVIYWGGYDWWIGIDDISTPLNLLGLMDHIIEKEWEGTTPERIQYLMNLVCVAKGWEIHPF